MHVWLPPSKQAAISDGRSSMITRKAVALLRLRLPVTMRIGLTLNADPMRTVCRTVPLPDVSPSGRTFLHACTGPLPPPHRLRSSRRGLPVQAAGSRGWSADEHPCRGAQARGASAAATATQQTADTASRQRIELPKNFDPASEEELYAWCGLLSLFLGYLDVKTLSVARHSLASCTLGIPLNVYSIAGITALLLRS